MRSLIRPISLIHRKLLFTLRHSCRCELLAITTRLHKIPLQRADLLVQQIVYLVNQADERIGHHPWISVFEPGRVGFAMGHRIRPIRPIRPIQ